MTDFQSAVELFQKLPAPMQWMALLLVAAKLITPLTPTRADNKALDWVLRTLNVLAMNVGKDKNFDEVLRKPTVLK